MLIIIFLLTYLSQVSTLKPTMTKDILPRTLYFALQGTKNEERRIENYPNSCDYCDIKEKTPKKEKPKKALPKTNREHPSSNKTNSRKVIFFQPAPRQGTPRGTLPGGSRGCSQVVQNPATALIPKANTPLADGTQIRWGLTTEEYPSFLFHVPYKSKSIRSAKFSLRDRKNRTLYETPIKLVGTPGIISVSLPKNEQPLLNNQWYRLYLLLDISCSENNSSQEKEIAQGWVLRQTLTPELKSDLDRATTLNKAIIYAENGIWTEALTTSAELRFLNPKDTQWNNLLKSAKLGKFANEPILDCCDPQ